MFDMILHLCYSLSLILQLRIEASKHVMSVNDHIPSDFRACACNVDQALFLPSPGMGRSILVLVLKYIFCCTCTYT